MIVSGNLEMDKSGNGFAVIRFCPYLTAKNRYGQRFGHMVSKVLVDGIENSLTTLGKKDPVSELNRTLWNSGLDSDKEVARKQKRKLPGYSNIYVVSDPSNPLTKARSSSTSLVRRSLTRFRQQCNLSSRMRPINPFDLWQGANFKLKLQKKDGYWNYDKSDFFCTFTLEDMTDAEPSKSGVHSTL